MANIEQLAILQKGVAQWNAWRAENPEVVPDLSAAELQETYLSGVNFSGTNLTRTVLIGVDFTGADLTTADLSQADLRFAKLKGAKLRGAALATAKGVDSAVLRSTMQPTVSNRRIAAMIAIPLVAIGFTCAGVITRLSSESPPALVDEQGDQAGSNVPSLDHFFAAEELSRQEIGVVSLRERTMELQLESNRVSQVAYLLALRGFCTSLELHGAQADALDAIRITNSANTQGWVFEEPRLCSELTRSDVATMDATVLGHSHKVE